MQNSNIQDRGFLPDIIDPADWVFGGATKLKGTILAPDRDWKKWMPLPEAQRKGVETQGCTVYGTLNCIEILLKAQYGIDADFSERFIGVLAGTTPEGNSPHRVAETIRKYGLIPESCLPFDDSINTWEEYYSPNPMEKSYLDEGQQWLNEWSFGHEWVPTSPDSLWDALQYSPLGVSVLAWKERNGMFYKDQRDSDNHWTALVVGGEYGKYWEVFDSYEQYIKRLEWEYPFGYAKRYSIEKIVERNSRIQTILNAIKQVLSLLFMQAREIPTGELPVITPQVPETTVPAVDRELNLHNFCKAIEKHEGYFPGSRSYRNHNPGNLKFTSYTRSLGALTKDDKDFCIFRDYPTGFEALKRFVLDARNNLLKAYKNKTIQEFFSVYAPSSENDPTRYAKVVADAVGVEPTVLLTDII